eukprot:2421944-Prorocentrum_lima.AAC.1
MAHAATTPTHVVSTPLPAANVNHFPQQPTNMCQPLPTTTRTRCVNHITLQPASSLHHFTRASHCHVAEIAT